jgi:hypothetical protein
MMPKAIDEALDRDERERDRRLSELEQELEEINSLELLQSVYRSRAMPLTMRMRAAIEALPFEKPKLAVTATVSGHGFAELLEARLRRNAEANPKTIEAAPIETAPLAPDRRFRRA